VGAVSGTESVVWECLLAYRTHVIVVLIGFDSLM
jgi:hypothetical protein